MPSHLSTVFWKIPVSATRNGAPLDPTVSPVYVAVMTTKASPTSSDLHAGSWETAGTETYARLLVGPSGGAVSLSAAGVAYVWWKVSDSLETPVVFAGTVNVT